MTLGSSVIYSKSYTQPTIATSSCEAELYAQFAAALYVQHFRWAAQFLELAQQGPTILYTDSQSAMKMLRRPEPGARSKHLDMRYKIKELVDKNVVHLVHEGTDTLVADILTKPLGPDKFRPHADRLLQGLVFPVGGARMNHEEQDRRRVGRPGALRGVFGLGIVPLVQPEAWRVYGFGGVPGSVQGRRAGLNTCRARRHEPGNGLWRGALTPDHYLA